MDYYVEQSNLPTLLDDPSIQDARINNLANQIYTLQLNQISESISCIKRDIRQNKFIIFFDESENYPSISLNQQKYRHLLSFRNTLNSISIYDLFQEKSHSF